MTVKEMGENESLKTAIILSLSYYFTSFPYL